MDKFIGKAKAYLDAQRGERVTLESWPARSARAPSTYSVASRKPSASRRATIRMPRRVESVEVLAEERPPRGRRGVRGRLRLGSAFYEKPHLGMTSARLPRKRQGATHRLLLFRLSARYGAHCGDGKGRVLGQARR